MEKSSIWDSGWSLRMISHNPAFMYVESGGDYLTEADILVDGRKPELHFYAKDGRLSSQRLTPLPTIPEELQIGSVRELRTERLLDSCCLVDLRLPGNQVISSSYDMVSATSVTGEGFVTILQDSRDTGCNLISTSEAGTFLVMRKAVLPMNGGTSTQILFAQLPILGECMPTEPGSDVWWDFAMEEMQNLAIIQPTLSKYIFKNYRSPGYQPNIQESIDMLQSFYDPFFIIGRSCSAISGYELTYRCCIKEPRFCKYLSNVSVSLCHGVYKIERRLSEQQNFFFDTRPTLDEARQLAWCIRLFSNHETCWLCFLIDWH